MKTYMQRAGIIGAFLFLIYVIFYMIVGLKTDTCFSQGLPGQEVVRRKLDRIEETLNKLGESIQKKGFRLTVHLK